MNPYVHEKLRELEEERLSRRPRFTHEPPRRRAVFGPLAALAGRTLRRAGENLESWATLPPPAKHERQIGAGAQ